MNKNIMVGTITKKVIDICNLQLEENKPIFCGEKNREHMKTEHPKDYEQYGDKIEEILSHPDFIAKHPKKDSIEYIKKYKNKNNEFVLVAVRASGKGVFFARTLFVMDKEKVNKYTVKDALKPY